MHNISVDKLCVSLTFVFLLSSFTMLILLLVVSGAFAYSVESKSIASTYSRLTLEQHVNTALNLTSYRPLYLTDFNSHFDCFNKMYINGSTLCKSLDKYMFYDPAIYVFHDANQFFQFLPEIVKPKLHNDTIGVFIP